jgi:thiol-disulfide isomerase/thioredoxin
MRALTIFAFCICIYSSVSSQQIRDFYLDDINGITKTYGDIKGGKLTIIDFWASWCKPCIKSMPKLEALRNAYESQGVELISINADGPRSIAKVRPLVKSLGLKSVVLIDINKEVMTDVDVYQLPTLLVVDASDKVVYRHEGYNEGDEKEVEREIKKLLASKK